MRSSAPKGSATNYKVFDSESNHLDKEEVNTLQVVPKALEKKIYTWTISATVLNVARKLMS